ncbi:RsbRD N-terminal domain-containing protein [Desulfamplus magnetovallimortis]|nr:RsbRD N-terminal domain-containing protein [Desulfamplus magnetovallimortis]
MEIDKQLDQAREIILNKWFDATIHSYPQDTARIFAKSSNRFDNPVGSATRQSLDAALGLIVDSLSTYRELLQKNGSALPEIDENALEEALDSVIRIRAVQSFSASMAVEFVFELKTILKSVLENPVNEVIYNLVDKVALAAFNRFMKCREDIFLLRANEAKRRIHRAFERAGLVTELAEEELSPARTNL